MSCGKCVEGETEAVGKPMAVVRQAVRIAVKSAEGVV
jgi:hypothetical protein